MRHSPMMSLGGGVTIREVEEERVKVSEILALKNQEFFLMTYMGIFRGKTTKVSPPEIEIIFPDIGEDEAGKNNNNLDTFNTNFEDFLTDQRREACGNG